MTNSAQTKNTEGVICKLQVAGQNFKKSQIILEKKTRFCMNEAKVISQFKIGYCAVEAVLIHFSFESKP